MQCVQCPEPTRATGDRLSKNMRFRTTDSPNPTSQQEEEEKEDDNDADDELDLCTVDQIDLMPLAAPEKQGLKEMMEITVDSGAAQSVLNPKHVPGVDLEPSEGSKRGLKYQGPGSELIPNLGQLVVSLMTLSGIVGRTTWQAAEVRKPLMAVSAINDKGNLVLFDLEGSAIVPSSAPELVEIRKLVKQVKDKIDLQRKGGVFTMRAWRADPVAAPKPVFPRQGR